MLHNLRCLLNEEMISMFKRFLFSIIGIVLMMTLIPSSGFAKTENSEIDIFISPAVYLESLKSYSLSEAIHSGLSKEDAERDVEFTKRAAKGFENLSREKQESFLEYVRNPEKILQAAFDGSDPNVEIVEIQNVNDKFNYLSPLSAYPNRSVSVIKTFNVYGLQAIEFGVSGLYSTHGTNVVKRITNKAWHAKITNTDIKISERLNTFEINSIQYKGIAQWRVDINNTLYGYVDGEVRGNYQGRTYGVLEKTWN